jgi:hypothetical protein
MTAERRGRKHPRCKKIQDEKNFKNFEKKFLTNSGLCAIIDLSKERKNPK